MSLLSTYKQAASIDLGPCVCAQLNKLQTEGQETFDTPTPSMFLSPWIVIVIVTKASLVIYSARLHHC